MAIPRRPARRRAPAPRRDPPARSESASAQGAPRGAEVVLDVEVEQGRVHLVLANCGDRVAIDVRVEFSRPLAGPDRSIVVSALSAFERLGVLRPGRALRVFWNAAPALLALRDQAAPFSAKVSWSERASPVRQHAIYEHDLSVFRQWPECVDGGTRCPWCGREPSTRP